MAATGSVEFRQCRCCLKSGDHEDIMEPYNRNGFREIFLDCFNLLLSANTKLTNMICTSCIRQLNDAVKFRTMVAESEERLLSEIGSNETDSGNDARLALPELDIKIEENEVKEEPHDSMDYNEADDIDNGSPPSNELELKKNETSEHETAEYITVEVPSLSSDLNNYVPRGSEIKNIVGQTKDSNTDVSSIKCKRAGSVLNNKVLDETINLWQDKINDLLLESAKKYTCTTCEYTTNKASSLKSHVKAHSAARTYICDTCSYITTEHMRLIRHLRIHTGEKPYACKICDKKFTQRENLNIHVRKHTGEKPYACEVCDKKFNISDALKRHISVHTGDRPHACQICDKKFTDRNHLYRHIRVHTGQKPYACEVCGKKFTEKRNLNLHVKIHTGDNLYACEICDKKFTERRNLTQHLRIHTGDKPYACELCDKKYNDKSHLNRHLRIHTTDKPYACKVCDKKFTDKSHLNRHARRTHQ